MLYIWRHMDRCPRKLLSASLKQHSLDGRYIWKRDYQHFQTNRMFMASPTAYPNPGWFMMIASAAAAFARYTFVMCVLGLPTDQPVRYLKYRNRPLHHAMLIRWLRRNSTSMAFQSSISDMVRRLAFGLGSIFFQPFCLQIGSQFSQPVTT